MTLNPVYSLVSWVLLRWHQLFTALGLTPGGGLNWALSIVALVVTARLLLVRVFLRQVRHQRAMQRIQPEITALRAKYRHDKAELQRQLLTLQRAEGVNALSGCLPLLLQVPVFLGLYHVLRHLSAAAGRARLLGAPLAATFRDSAGTLHQLGGSPGLTRLVILALLLVSAAAAVATQVLVRAGAPVPPAGTAATIQKAMLYLVPAGVLVSGLVVNLPLGVLLYWCTSNLWTLGQQAVIQRS